ncbi:ORF195 [Saltwater crocodilepox virus]|nr:ORF195 [Saltwater crocodilepox virus]
MASRIEEVRFDRNSLLADDFRLVFLGGSGSGKTVYLLSLLRGMVRKFRHVFLMLPVPNPAYDGYVWPDHITTVANEHQLDYALLRYKAFAEELSKSASRRKAVLLVLDDLGDLQYRSRELAPIFNHGRHVNISVAVLCQTFRHIPHSCKTSITHLVCCSVVMNDLENLLKYMSVAMEKKKLLRFVDMFCSNNKKRKVLIIENSLFSGGRARVCTDAVDKRVLAGELDLDVLRAQFSRMRANLKEAIEEP